MKMVSEDKKLELIRARKFTGEKPNPQLWSECDKAYIAGAVDSDGTISSSSRKNYRYPIFEFKGCSKLPIVLAEEFGISTVRKVPKEPGCFAWNITDQKELLKFLLSIEPYLRLKKNEANIALRMLELLIAKSEKNWKEETTKLSKRLSEIKENRRNEAIEQWKK